MRPSDATYIGQGEGIRMTFTDVTGALYTPTNATLTIQLVGGSTTTIDLASFTLLSTGVYRYVYVPTVAGNYAVRIVSTSANAVADQSSFTVLPNNIR